MATDAPTKPRIVKAGLFEIEVHGESNSHITVSVKDGKKRLGFVDEDLGNFSVYFTQEEGQEPRANDLEKGLFEQLKNHLERIARDV